MEGKKPKIRFEGYSDDWIRYKLSEITDKYKDLIPTPTNGYWRLGVRSHANGTFLTYVPPGKQLGETELSKVVPDNLMFNIVFAWEHAVAITKDGDEKALVSHRFPQFSFHEDMVPDFFRYAILDERFRHHLWLASPSGAGRNKTLIMDEALEYEFVVPEKLEQEKIAEFLDYISMIIDYHEKKYDKLKMIKKDMLDKMFVKAGERTPKIRFSEFTEEWEEHELNDYLETSCEKNTENIYTKEDVLSVSGDFGVVNQIEFQGRSYAGASVQKYSVLRTDDVVYTKSPLRKNPYGVIKTNKGKTGIVSVLYGVFHPKENVYPPFVQTYFEQDARLNNYLRPLVNKGAKNTLQISDEESLNGKVYFAPTVEEQKKIVEFFLNIDNLVQFHQEKIDKFNNIKTACLNNMLI